jgi:hypothetical protein
MPPKITEDDEIDLKSEGDQDEETINDIIGKHWKDDGADDAPAVAEPLPEPEPVKVVSEEEGDQLASAAKFKKIKAAKESNDELAELDQGKVPGEKPAEPPVEPETTAEPAKPPEFEAIMAALGEPERAVLTQRLAVADEFRTIFDSGKDHFAATGLGDNPKDAFKRLADISQYATANPDEYIAWATNQLSGGKAEELLGKAAERLGLKLAPKDAPPAEDDVFADPVVKELREENARLKAQITPPPLLGPDNPQRRVANDLESFVRETGADGKLRRPLFNEVAPDMAKAAQARFASTGQPVTQAELAQFYDTAESAYLAARGLTKATPTPAPVTPAAQAPAPVPQIDPIKAAALAKSQAASKSLDGSGQGTGRHPDKVMSPEEFLHSIYKE